MHFPATVNVDSDSDVPSNRSILDAVQHIYECSFDTIWLDECLIAPLIMSIVQVLTL